MMILTTKYEVGTISQEVSNMNSAPGFGYTLTSLQF